MVNEGRLSVYQPTIKTIFTKPRPLHKRKFYQYVQQDFQLV